MLKKILNFAKFVGLALVLALIIVVSKDFVLKRPVEDKKVISAELIFGELSKANELVSVKYPYKTIGVFTNSKEFYGIEIPFTSKKFILSFGGIINAGINLSEIKIDLNENKKTLTITLPEAKILSNDFSHESISIYDESTALFNPIKISDYKEFALTQEDKILDEAIDSGILETTKENAKESILNMLKLIDESLVNEYKIEFK